MRTLLLLLLASFTAQAAPLPPMPTGMTSAMTVKRKPPLLSPKHASASKDKRMFRVASVTEPPLLPMEGFYERVQTEYGTEQFTAQVFQPRNQAVLIELSWDAFPGEWAGLAYFPAYPSDQFVTAGVVTFQPKIFTRAKATPVMPTGMVRVVTTGKAIWINPQIRGAFARRGK